MGEKGDKDTPPLPLLKKTYLYTYEELFSKTL